MSSAAYGSEQALAEVAAEHLSARVASPRVLVGGLGMGFTLRAVLEVFRSCRVTVAELLPDVVRYNRDFVGHLTDHPLRDPRVELFEGDVALALGERTWDAILLDVDNGPDALTVAQNRGLYGEAGVGRIARALAPGGVLVVWSAYACEPFTRRLRQAGLEAETRMVRARAHVGKGGRHTLFVGRSRASR